MPPALAALTLSPDEIRSASSEVGQRLVLRGILPPDVPTRGVPGQIVAGIQRGAFGVGATFGDALGVLFPDTGKGITDFFKSYQMQSSGGMIEQAAETATQSLGVLGAVAGAGVAAGVGAPALGTLAMVGTPAVFGLAQATETRNLLQAVNSEVVKRGGKPLTSGEIATAMATNGVIEFGGEFLSELLFLKRFFPGSVAFNGAKEAVRSYFVKPETNAAIRLVAKATEESVRAGLREAPEEFVQNLGEAAVTRAALGPERLRMAQEAGIQVPGTPVEEGLQAAKIALVAGPFFAAGGAASARLLRGRQTAESPQAPPQGAPAADVARATTTAPSPALAPLVAPEVAPGPEPLIPPQAPSAPGRVQGAGFEMLGQEEETAARAEAQAQATQAAAERAAGVPVPLVVTPETTLPTAEIMRTIAEARGKAPLPTAREVAGVPPAPPPVIPPTAGFPPTVETTQALTEAPLPSALEAGLRRRGEEVAALTPAQAERRQDAVAFLATGQAPRRGMLAFSRAEAMDAFLTHLSDQPDVALNNLNLPGGFQGYVRWFTRAGYSRREAQENVGRGFDLLRDRLQDQQPPPPPPGVPPSVEGPAPTTVERTIPGVPLATPEQAARYAEAPVLGIRPRPGVPTQEAGEPAPVPPAAPVVSPAQAAMQADVVSALRNMGYTARDAQAAAETAMAQNPGSFEDALRLALAPRAAGLTQTEAPPAVQGARVAAPSPEPAGDLLYKGYTIRQVGPQWHVLTPEGDVLFRATSEVGARSRIDRLGEGGGIIPQEAPPVAPAGPLAEAVPSQQREAPPAPAGPTTLAELSQQLEQQGAATQAQIQREGLEAEAGTRLRPTVEQAPPTGMFEQEQALPLGVPPAVPTPPARAPLSGLPGDLDAIARRAVGPVGQMVEQGMTTTQIEQALREGVHTAHGEAGMASLLQQLQAEGITGETPLLTLVDQMISRSYGLQTEADIRQEAMQGQPDILAVIRGTETQGRFAGQRGIKTAGSSLATEFAELVGIREGSRSIVSGLVNNQSGLTPQHMAEKLEGLGYLPEATEGALLDALRERLRTGQPMGPRYQAGGVEEPLGFLRRLWQRMTPGGDRPDASLTTKLQGQAIDARLQHVAAGETIISLTATDPVTGRATTIPGIRRREGSVEVVRAIVPHAMVEQLRTTGVVAFEGQTLRPGRAGMHDLATLGQLVRDPEVEHLHYILVDDQGKALRVIEVSSRLPASAVPFVKAPGQPVSLGFIQKGMRDLLTYMRQAGATGYYLLHNHPSGNPDPSGADRRFTARLAATVPGFQGHVVINSVRYAVIDQAGDVSQAEIGTGRPDPFLQPSLGRPYTDVEIHTTADAAWVGAALAQPNFVTVVLVNKRPQGEARIVRGVVLVPETALTQPHADVKAYLEALQREFGASLATAFYDGSNRTVQIATEMLYRDGVLADAVTVLPQGTAFSLAVDAPELAPSPEAIAARRLTEAGAERVMEPPAELRAEQSGQTAGGVQEEAPVIRTQAQWKALVDEAIQQLPPVAGGYVRIYRGEAVHGRPSAGSPVSDWLRDTPEYQAMLQATGRWFSTSTDEVSWYLRHNADIGPGRVGPVQLTYVDVPQTVADEGRVANQPAEIRRFSRRPAVEYFVPREYAARATVVPFGEGVVQEEAPTLPTPPRGPAVRDLPNTIAGVTVAQAGKLATAYRMMFDVGGSLHSSHLQQPLAEATFRKLRITWPQMEAIGQETLLRWLAHPDELHALRERFRRDPTATMSNAENAAWTQLTTALMDDLDVKRSLGEIDQVTFDREFDQLIKNDLLMPGASSLGRGLAMQRHFQQVGAYRLADFLARLEKKQGKALTDEEKRREARTFMDILRSGDRDAIRQQLEQTTDPTLLDYYMELYYGSLLSGLPTLNINALGTLAHITFQKFVVGPTAVGLDWMISGFSGRERQRYMQEVFADWNATWKNAGQQYREAWYWWKAPFPRAVRGEQPVGVPPPERLAQGLGMTRAHVLDLTGAEAFSRAPLQNANGTPHQWGPLMRRLAPFVGAASRVLAATDAVAANMAFDGAVAKLATRQGLQQFGADNQEQVHNFVEQVKTHLTLFPEIEAAAKAEARSTTFNDPGGGLARAILGARQAPQPFGVFFRLLTPFANTPDRLLARGLELVPALGLPVGIREAGYTAKGFLADFRTGEPRAVEIAAKQVVGLMLGSMAAVLWDRDLLTGPLPVDPDERHAWERQGKLPFAIRMGDNWVEYRRVEPFISMPFGAMTAGFQAIKTIQQERAKQGLLLDASSMEDISAIGTGVAFNLVKFLLDSSYFSGLANFFGSITRTSEGFATGLTQQLVSATLPLSGLLRNVNRSLEASGWLGTEPGVVLMRQRESVGEAYSRAIPGLATATRPRLNVFGQPAVSEEPLLGAVGGLLSPIRRRLASDDPVEQVFEQLQFRPGQPPRRQLETTVGRRLEDEEYDAYVTRRGELARETLDRMVVLPFFGALPADRQLARIKQAFSAATRRARREVFGQPETVQERRERFEAARAAAE